MPSANVALGQKIRSTRIAAELTLQQVAEHAGVLRSLMSQVERGLANPSIATLRNIAAAMGVPVASMFYDPAPVTPRAAQTADASGRSLVVRRDERKRLQLPKSRVKYELLTPDFNRQVEFLWIEYGPGDVTPYSPLGHKGEENAICLKGSIVVTIEEQEFVLTEGDSISFDCLRPHRVENRSSATAIVVSAITPPSF